MSNDENTTRNVQGTKQDATQDTVQDAAQDTVQGTAQDSVQDAKHDTAIGKIIKKRHTADKEWITAYQTSNTRLEVAKKLGVTVSSVIQREQKLRKKGVGLKEMQSQRKRGMAVDDMNKFIKELATQKN